MAGSNVRQNYGDYIGYLYNDKTKIREVTFQVTSACNLRCSYCYEHHKSNERMSFETGKKIVDFVIDSWKKDDPNAVINKTVRTIVFSFIGGEPFLEVELIDKICEYFLIRCALEKCTLSKGLRIVITTNGINYFDRKVQQFIERYKRFLSLTVSVDGVKELHDKNRVDAFGNGSFDLAFKAMMDSKKLGELQTKMTFVPDSFGYIYDSIKMMLDVGATAVSANYAYEPIYTENDAKILYQQLKKVADYLIDTKDNRFVTILSEYVGNPNDKDNDRNYCGGTGEMLAFAPDGKAYPCVRYAPIAIGKEKSADVCIGDYNGIYNTKHTVWLKHKLDGITRTSQSTAECNNCPVASGCGWCSAYNYEATGDINRRVTNICWAHKARVLATCYYFNRRFLELGDVAPKRINLSEQDSLKIVSEHELKELKKYENLAIKTFLNQEK